MQIHNYDDQDDELSYLDSYLDYTNSYYRCLLVECFWFSIRKGC